MTERIVRVLDTSRPPRTTQTAAEIAERTGLPSSTTHRIIGNLVAAGLLERDDENRIRLGMRLWELALRGSSALRLRQAALPHMERVQTLIREHTQLAVLEHERRRSFSNASHTRTRAPTSRASPGDCR